MSGPAPSQVKAGAARHADGRQTALTPVDPASGAGNTRPMPAVVATVSIKDPEVARVALAELRLNVVPRTPGFVSACWLEPIDGAGMSIVVFETREHADKTVAYPLPPLPGVSPASAPRGGGGRRLS